MRHIILALFIALFMVSCMGSAGANYQMDNDKKDKMHKNMGGGY